MHAYFFIYNNFINKTQIQKTSQGHNKGIERYTPIRKETMRNAIFNLKPSKRYDFHLI